MNRRVNTERPSSRYLRLAAVCCLWAVLGLLHASASGPAYGWTAVIVSAGLGLAVLLLAASDTPWASLLTAVVLLAVSPIVQKAWVMESQGGDALTFLKTMLVLGGLLLLAQLEAGAHPQPPEGAEEY
jgi:hypothetical protein